MPSLNATSVPYSVASKQQQKLSTFALPTTNQPTNQTLLIAIDFVYVLSFRFCVKKKFYLVNMNSLRLFRNVTRITSIKVGKRYASYYPVNDDISGLNSEQKQVRLNFFFLLSFISWCFLSMLFSDSLALQLLLL